MKLSAFAKTCLWGLAAVIFTLLYGPLVLPVASSFFTVSHGDVVWQEPSASAYAALLQNDSILVAFGNTLIVGFSATVLALMIGTLLALHYCSGKSISRELMQFAVFLPFLMPPIITGLALLIFFRETDIPRSLTTIIIGHTVFVLTLAYRTVVMRLQSLDASQIEASYDLGASGLQTFWHVVMPHLQSALSGAAVLSFALSFDETLITLLVTGTDNTLPIRLWAMMRLGFTPDINALVAFVLLLTVVLCILAVRQLMPEGGYEA